MVQLVCAEDVGWRLQTFNPSLCIRGRLACVILALPPIISQPDPHQLGFSQVSKEEGMKLWNILLIWELFELLGSHHGTSAVPVPPLR